MSLLSSVFKKMFYLVELRRPAPLTFRRVSGTNHLGAAQRRRMVVYLQTYQNRFSGQPARRLKNCVRPAAAPPSSPDEALAKAGRFRDDFQLFFCGHLLKLLHLSLEAVVLTSLLFCWNANISSIYAPNQIELGCTL